MPAVRGRLSLTPVRGLTAVAQCVAQRMITSTTKRPITM